MVLINISNGNFKVHFHNSSGLFFSNKTLLIKKKRKRNNNEKENPENKSQQLYGLKYIINRRTEKNGDVERTVPNLSAS